MSERPLPAPVIQHQPPHSLLRLLAGAVALGIDRLSDYAAQLESRIPMVPGDPESTETRRGTAMAVGLVLSLEDYARAGLTATGRARRTITHAFGPVTSLLTTVWPGTAVATRVDQLRLWLQGEMERIVTIGRLEAPRAEQLAVRAFEETVAVVVDHLAQSDALRALIAGASAGLTKTAVEEVREGSAVADDRAEALIRRILRRPSVATE
jgi:hypothetical protein